jgi:undecaprenyl-diphosphatase
MAGLEISGSNPDVTLLYDINGLARHAPGWMDRTIAFLGEYGLPLAMVLLVAACWWTERRRAASVDAAAASVAAVVWAPLAAAIAVLANVPIRGLVERPRPFTDHGGLDVLVHGKHGFSFVSDHATLTMAMAAGLFVANRRCGLIGIAMALVEGFCRVFLGVHYPTDVIGGFALGTAVALLLSPLAMATLTPLMTAVGCSGQVGWLIRPRHRTGRRGSRGLRLREGAGRPDPQTSGQPGGPQEPTGRSTARDPRGPGDGEQGPGEPDLAA